MTQTAKGSHVVKTPDLKSINPSDLKIARAQAHKAVQIIAKAAIANLPAKPDDSHTNFEWRSADGAFFIAPLEGVDGVIEIGLRIADLKLIARSAGEKRAFPLNGQSHNAAIQWLDEFLAAAGKKPGAGADVAYELPANVDAIDLYAVNESASAFAGLSAWFGFTAALLDAFVKRNAAITPGPSPVRCWPHHFDIATYVSLEAGDAETARGVGVGLSPGDEAYDEPYFYINPWPHLNPQGLPPAPAPGHWHTDGFVGLIATATEIVSTGDPADAAKSFVNAAFEIGRKALKA